MMLQKYQEKMSPNHSNKAYFAFPMLPLTALNKKNLKRGLKVSHSACNFNNACERKQGRHSLPVGICKKFPDLFDTYINRLITLDSLSRTSCSEVFCKETTLKHIIKSQEKIRDRVSRPATLKKL